MSESDNKMEHAMHKLLGQGVKPLKQNRMTPYRPPLDATPKQRLLDNARVMEELLAESDESASYESGDELKFLRAGYSSRLLKKIKTRRLFNTRRARLAWLNYRRCKTSDSRVCKRVRSLKS